MYCLLKHFCQLKATFEINSVCIALESQFPTGHPPSTFNPCHHPMRYLKSFTAMMVETWWGMLEGILDYF